MEEALVKLNRDMYLVHKTHADTATEDRKRTFK
jgi:hypothetical protein